MASVRPEPDFHETNALPAHHHPDPLFRPALSVLAVYGLLMLLVSIGAWALITQDWVRQQKIQETELTSLSFSLSGKLTSTIALTEQSLRAIGHLTLENLHAAATSTLHEAVEREIRLHPDLGGVIIWQPDERLLFKTKATDNAGLTPDSPASTYFAQHPDRTLRVHAALHGADGQTYLPVEHVLRDANGTPLLYLCGLVRTEGITRFFESIRLTGRDDAIVLDENARALLRLDHGNTDALPDFISILADDTLQQSRNFGTIYRHAGDSYLGVFHWLDDRPLIVGISRPSHVARAGFLEMKQRLVIAMTTLLAILALLAWLVYCDARRHRTAREVLRKINASLEHRVHLRTAELEQSNRELVAFSHSVSHDLRAPLRAINGFAHALREDYGTQLDGRARDYMDRICRASVRLGELIDELLSLANLSRTPLDIREVDPGALAHEIVDELRHETPERALVFECGNMTRVEADEALLRNALVNLIGNAWKFTRSRHPAIIRLAVEDEGDFKRYTLSDNGIGFDMAHAKRLFQPFQQLHGNQGFGGSGIGLASVRRIIERHGGQIWAEARPEEGAHFIFTLPVRPQVIRRQRVPKIRP